MTLRQTLAALLLTSLPAFADELATAQRHFHDAVARVAASGADVRSAALALRSCKNGKLQLAFDGSVKKLEQTRRALEQGRRQTEALRRGLEAVRRDIETKPHQSTAYTERLRREYAEPLEARVVPAFDTYVSGLSEYARIIKAYAEFCAKPVDGTNFVASVEPAIDALEQRAEALSTGLGPVPQTDKPAHLVARRNHRK